MNKKQLKYVENLRKDSIPWVEVAKQFNKTFKTSYSHDTLRHRLAKQSNMPGKSKYRSHLVIPDGQIKKGVPTKHWEALAKLVLETQPDVIVNIGDFWDMPSLSGYEGKGTKSAEGRRIQNDIDAGNRVMDAFMNTISSTSYSPELHFTIGNHEQRIERAVKEEPKFEGLLGYNLLHLDGWNVHDFLKPVTIDGVAYAHYFYNQMSGRPIGGTIDAMLKKIGHSFTQGHRQEFQVGRRDLNNGTCQYGVVAGAFYMHEENYKGPQANDHWRGVLLKHDVKDGAYDINVISLDRLLRKFT